MLNWAITFLVIGLVAGVLGISGVAGTATYIASGKCSVLSAQDFPEDSGLSTQDFFRAQHSLSTGSPVESRLNGRIEFPPDGFFL